MQTLVTEYKKRVRDYLKWVGIYGNSPDPFRSNNLSQVKCPLGMKDPGIIHVDIKSIFFL